MMTGGSADVPVCGAAARTQGVQRKGPTAHGCEAAADALACGYAGYAVRTPPRRTVRVAAAERRAAPADTALGPDGVTVQRRNRI